MKWRRTREGGERREREVWGEKKEKQREREVKHVLSSLVIEFSSRTCVVH